MKVQKSGRWEVGGGRWKVGFFWKIFSNKEAGRRMVEIKSLPCRAELSRAVTGDGIRAWRPRGVAKRPRSMETEGRCHRRHHHRGGGDGGDSGRKHVWSRGQCATSATAAMADVGVDEAMAGRGRNHVIGRPCHRSAVPCRSAVRRAILVRSSWCDFGAGADRI